LNSFQTPTRQLAPLLNLPDGRQANPARWRDLVLLLFIFLFLTYFPVIVLPFVLFINSFYKARGPVVPSLKGYTKFFDKYRLRAIWFLFIAMNLYQIFRCNQPAPLS